MELVLLTVPRCCHMAGFGERMTAALDDCRHALGSDD
jgi:hypothetical protein